MKVVNCRRCGRLFNRITRDICPQCVRAEDEAYKTIRTYLRSNKDVHLAELAEATNVPEDWIVDMIRDGRLILRDHPNLFAACERCGAPTQEGRYCAKCAGEMSTAFSAAAQDLQQKKLKAVQKAVQPHRPGYYSQDGRNK